MNANQQAKSLYDQFIKLHPNSKEQFVFNLENVLRWQWHIREAGSRPELETVKITRSATAEKIAKTRSFSLFTQMPSYMQERYLRIAEMFPGVQFYACGSRVTGEFIETWSGASIKKLRQQLKKPAKDESDYDVCVDLKPGSGLTLEMIREKIAPLGDLLNHGVPPEQKIAIPMWDFSRLPASEHANVIALFKAQNWGELMAIHNRYVLSMNYYCCDEKPIIRYFQWAIDNGTIKNDEQKSEKTTDNLDQ